MNKKNVFESYEKIADWFNEVRSREFFEKPYLDFIIKYLPSNAMVLDLGCGMGEPFTQYFIDKDFHVTGIDGSQKMINFCRKKYPEQNFVVADMREMKLNQKFDLIIAWNSYFHLSKQDQIKMFEIFKSHINNNGILAFTSSPNEAEVWANNGGEELYHASLGKTKYVNLLENHGFQVLNHNIKNENLELVIIGQYINSSN